MLHTQFKLSLVFLLGFSVKGLIAQESFNTAGNIASGSGGSVSYSVGQLAYTSNTGTSGSASNGVQQAFEVSGLTLLEEFIDINLSVTTYPNPVTDHLILTVENPNLLTLNFQLFDLRGKLIQSDEIINDQTNVSMNNLAPAVYFLNIIQGNKEVRTFKIIKN